MLGTVLHHHRAPAYNQSCLFLLCPVPFELPFTHPEVFLVALPAALLALATGFWVSRRPGLGVRAVGQRPGLLGLGMALILSGIGLGLAEPRWGLPDHPNLTVHVLLDASRSMDVRDESGRSRWAVAQALLEKLWATPRPGLRFSLKLVTGDLVPLVPLGEDHPLLSDALQIARPGELGSPGSSLGRCIVQALREIPHGEPALLLLLSDGEETFEARADALYRAQEALKLADIPLWALPLGSHDPSPVPGVQAGLEARSRADLAFLQSLTQKSQGLLLDPKQDWITLLQKAAQGKQSLPVSRSKVPAHPEAGAWLALLGLGLWIWGAGLPMRSWRLILPCVFWAALPGQAQPLPNALRAWLAQRALAEGDLPAAQRWLPKATNPETALLAAQIRLKSKDPAGARRMLQPFSGLEWMRPSPSWRAPVLLMAARTQWLEGKPEEARKFLEHLLLEQPGQAQAVHNLQILLQDPPPPPPPNKQTPPPPRPSFGAQKDELEGFRQRLPKASPPPQGVRDW